MYEFTTKRLVLLSQCLNTLGNKLAKKRVDNLSDISSSKKKTVDSPKELYEIFEQSHSLEVHIDSPKGSKKGFGHKKRELPFDYGEIPSLINPADNMGWDIIFPPSEEPTGGKLIQIGIVKVNDDKEIWKEKAGKAPPVGNDKVIVSKVGKISEKDKEIITDFFKTMWQFKKIKWY
jgi:hypothetical protein